MRSSSSFVARRSSGGCWPSHRLDANILVRAVLGKRVKQILNDCGGHVGFFAPDTAYADAEHYVPEILTGHDRADEVQGALAYLRELQNVVLLVPANVYADRRDAALPRIEARDPDDWPILATALVLDCPIWIEDRDFFGAGVPTWTTDRVEFYLGDKPSG